MITYGGCSFGASRLVTQDSYCLFIRESPSPSPVHSLSESSAFTFLTYMAIMEHILMLPSSRVPSSNQSVRWRSRRSLLLDIGRAATCLGRKCDVVIVVSMENAGSRLQSDVWEVLLAWCFIQREGLAHVEKFGYSLNECTIQEPNEKLCNQEAEQKGQIEQETDLNLYIIFKSIGFY